MRNALIIAAKEWSRFFANRGYAVLTVLLPGLLLWGMYSAMGEMDMAGGKDEELVVAVENAPGSFLAISSIPDLKTISAPAGLDSPEKIEKALDNEDFSLLVRFPEHFDALVAAYDISSGKAAPDVELFYDSSATSSSQAFALVSEALDAYEATIANKFDINADPTATYDFATEDEIAARMFSSMFPMLIVFLVFSSIVAVAAESLAGEKERGTLASVLATPVARRDIALGKAIAVSAVSLLAGVFTIAGLILGMSSMMKSMSGEALSMKAYGPADYAWLALTVLSVTVLLAVVSILLSGLAKTTKDAQVLSLPAYAVVMAAGVASMIADGAKTGAGWYAIPVYNAIEAMKGIFALEPSPVAIAVACLTNLALAGLGVVLLSKMLDSERLMFQR